MMAAILTLHDQREPIIAAARSLAWQSGLDVEVMEGLVDKVLGRAQRERLRAFVRDPDNDEGTG